MFRVKEKFAWKEVSVHEKLSENSSRCKTIQFEKYYVVEKKIDDVWKTISSVNFLQEESAYEVMVYHIKNIPIIEKSKMLPGGNKYHRDLTDKK